MRIALCNEVLAPRAFAEQCDLAARLGYDGLEVAPFTLADDPVALDAGARRVLARQACDAGIAITGLHWLLAAPAGLSITSADKGVRARTRDALKALVGLCADLGGDILVHGSPGQRRIPPGMDRGEARARARDALSEAGEAAGRAGVTYCLEALPADKTELMTSLDESVAMVREIGNPALRPMLDACAQSRTEDAPLAAIIRARFVRDGFAHVQLNDPNRRGPGQGGLRFAPVLEALVEVGYGGALAVEPFVCDPDGPTTAARAIGYLRGILEVMTDAPMPGSEAA